MAKPSAAAPKPVPATAAKTSAKTPAPPARQKPAAAKAAGAKATPPANIPPPAKGSLLNVKTVGGGLAALALVGVAGFVLLRRRAGFEVMDASDFDSDPLAADNPFAELGDDLAGGGGTQSDLANAGASSFALDQSSESEAEAATSLQKDLFDAAATQTDTGASPQESDAAGETMDTLSEMPTTPMMDGAAAMPAAGAANADVMNMLREFESRISSLESRLGEVTESKERLERQVAAQTEELRVQRAAIARTQRAVRNLNRPEDEAPTEPALRDPSRPGGPRTDG
jgi:hypothetical protein